MLVVVVDTNVWVSAFLSPHGTPAKLLKAFAQESLLPVYSAGIETEYRDVLYRPRLNISQDVLAEFMEMLADSGHRASPTDFDTKTLPDVSDAPFIATALAAKCPVITGNRKHFPPETGVKILSPAEALARL
jgi:putative PIN family toxin of toxin-antitoxin system